MIRLKGIGKKLALTLLWLGIAWAMISKDQYSISVFIIIASVITFLWTIDIDKITSLSVDMKRNKLELNKSVEETKKIANEIEATANEVEVTANAFSKTIKTFLNFNLADMQKQGRMFLNIPWEDAAKFVNEAIELSAILNDSDEETAELIIKSKCKVIELFEFDAKDFFEPEKIDFKTIISSGISVSYGAILYDFKKVAVDFEQLYSLKERIVEDKQLLWKSNVDKLKKFYDKNF